MNDLIGKPRRRDPPLIHARLPLKDARRAHEMIEARQVIGKILLKPVRLVHTRRSRLSSPLPSAESRPSASVDTAAGVWNVGSLLPNFARFLHHG